jgi:electron transport complex protein RnfG
MSKQHPVIIAALLLTLFAVTGSGLVALTYEATAERIAANEREALLRSLHALVPAASIDNDIINDSLLLDSPELLGGSKIRVYLGRKQGKPVAAVFGSIVPDGYSGPIKLLVAVHVDGTLGGVRVISHKETPGLGDKVEEERSDWIHSFDGKSLGNPDIARWKVKRDGGDFDQFTGATVTPRSIVHAVMQTLIYFRENGHRLFPAPSAATGDKA